MDGRADFRAKRRRRQAALSELQEDAIPIREPVRRPLASPRRVVPTEADIRRNLQHYLPEQQSFAKGDRVFDVGSPHRIGRCSAKGPEVSEVEWPDRVRQNVTNEFLRKAKP